MRTPAEVLAEYRALKDHLDLLAYRWECDRPDCDGLPHEGWLHHHARAAQHEPVGYDTWLLLTGRGFGKTRTGAETAKKWGRQRRSFIAVIAKNDRECRNICFEGPAGLLAVIPDREISVYRGTPGETRLILKNGTVYRAFSAEQPDNLRGYAFDAAWCDEFGAWPRQTAQDALDNLWFALREAPEPHVVVTTTPKPNAHVKAMLGDQREPRPGLFVTRGHMRDNLANLSEVAVREIVGKYEGTRLGRQELAGEILDDVEGALWTQALIDDFRVDQAPPTVRTVVAVDPAITANEHSDETGIIVASRDSVGHAFVEADHTMKGRPDEWARRVVWAYDTHEADAIVVEVNQGGDMVEATLRTVRDTLPIRKVVATKGKRTRAEPIAALYEQGRIHHVGLFPQLEDQMTTWLPDDPQSPDRLDALVWGLTDLMTQGGADAYLRALAVICPACGWPHPKGTTGGCHKCSQPLPEAA